MLDKLKLIAKQAVFGAMPSPWQSDELVRVAVQTSDGFDEPFWTAALDRALPAWRTRVELRCMPGDLAFLHAARDADACSTMSLSPALFHPSRLRWINSLPAGINLLDIPEPPDSICLTTSRGIAARSMGEHALMLLLALHRQLPRIYRHQQAWNWSQEGLLGHAPELRESTVAVFGLGAAGTETAKLCKALGMRVIGVRRSPDNPDGLCDEIWPLADFSAILPRVDVIFLALPLTRATRGLIGDIELKRMKPTAIIINVARGELIEEDPLAAALREGRIGGAGLDVMTREPPADDSPLRDCPNLLVTPHLAGNLHKFTPEIAARFTRNLAAFLSGQPLEGLQPRDHWREHRP